MEQILHLKMKEEYREQVLLSSLLNWKRGDERTEADLIRILSKLIKLKSNFIFKLQTLIIFWSKFSYNFNKSSSENIPSWKLENQI